MAELPERAEYHHLQRRDHASDKNGEWLLAPDILAVMPDRTIQQNTITYSATIMLARRMTNDALHSASWLR